MIQLVRVGDRDRGVGNLPVTRKLLEGGCVLETECTQTQACSSQMWCSAEKSRRSCHWATGLIGQERPRLSLLRGPVSQEPPNGNHLAEVIRVVVRDEEKLSQIRL